MGKPDAKDALYLMPIHSSVMITIKVIDGKGPNFDWLITRVPNGWIYTPQSGAFVDSVFVPETTFQSTVI